MSSNDTFTKVVQVAALSTSAYLGGMTYSISHMTIPALLPPITAPRQAAREWHQVYKIGAKTGPPLGLLTLFSFGWLAYANDGLSTPQGVAYLICAAAGGSNMPWTLAVMRPTNDALTRVAKEPEMVGTVTATAKERVSDEEVVRLLKKWSRLNAVRSVGAVVAAVVGISAAVGLIA